MVNHSLQTINYRTNNRCRAIGAVTVTVVGVAFLQYNRPAAAHDGHHHSPTTAHEAEEHKLEEDQAKAKEAESKESEGDGDKGAEEGGKDSNSEDGAKTPSESGSEDGDKEKADDKKEDGDKKEEDKSKDEKYVSPIYDGVCCITHHPALQNAVYFLDGGMLILHRRRTNRKFLRRTEKVGQAFSAFTVNPLVDINFLEGLPNYVLFTYSGMR
jgi:hypothetical protein